MIHTVYFVSDSRYSIFSFVLSCRCKSKFKARRKACFDRLDPNTAISNHTTTIFHWTHRFGPNKFNGLIFNVREPVSRLESAYYYQSPFHCAACKLNFKSYQKDPFFYDTYPTLYILANSLNPNTNFSSIQRMYSDESYPQRIVTAAASAENNDPKQMLRKYFYFAGATPRYGHVTAGYRFYVQRSNWNPSSPNNSNIIKVVFATRTEFLWDDVETIDLMLGGTGNFSTLRNHKETHITSDQRINQMKFADGSHETFLVCCALLPEMNDYRKIIDHAINLDEEDRIETYQTTWKRCGVSNWNDLETRCATTELSIGRPD